MFNTYSRIYFRLQTEPGEPASAAWPPAMWKSAVAAALVATSSATPGPAPPPQIPARFSATVSWQCNGVPAPECGGLGKVSEVYQDLEANRTLLVGLRSGEPFGPGYTHSNVLVIAPPYPNPLLRFVWRTHTRNASCSRSPTSRASPFFAHPVSTPAGKETINGVVCDKWTNGVTPGSEPYPDLWSVWFKAGQSTGTAAVVARISYTQQTNPMHGFPIPGWTYVYDFSDFTTDPIPSSTFEPPPDWQVACPEPPPPAPPPPPRPPPPPPGPKTCHCFKCGDSAASKLPTGTKCAPERPSCNPYDGPGKGCYNVECDPDGAGVAKGVCACDGSGLCVKADEIT